MNEVLELQMVDAPEVDAPEAAEEPALHTDGSSVSFAC